MPDASAFTLVKSSQPGGGAASARVSLAERIWATLGALACLAVLVTAASITPSAKGYNTHTQLGLPPCMWAAMSGRPCPTCGMTTAFSYAAHADLWSSFRCQPFGAFLALVTAAMFWVCLHVAFTGSKALIMVGGLLKGWTWWLLGVAFVASWLYKMAVWQG